MSSPSQLRLQGNELFKAQQFQEAAQCYQKAVVLLPWPPGPGDKEEMDHEDEDGLSQPLAISVRLNLVSCYHRLGSQLDEAVRLCSEVLQQQPAHPKALFRRGCAHLAAAKAAADPEGKREELQNARRDLLQAAKVEPGDRQLRQLLDEVTEALQQLPQLPRGGFAGLYDDRSTVPDPPRKVIARAESGMRCWVRQRARWLGIAEEEVAQEPGDFENDGTLRAVLRRRRNPDALPESDEELPELSESEQEMLADCLEATARPFPQPKRPLSLAQAVRCAEDLWAEGESA